MVLTRELSLNQLGLSQCNELIVPSVLIRIRGIRYKEANSKSFRHMLPKSSGYDGKAASGDCPKTNEQRSTAFMAGGSLAAGTFMVFLLSLEYPWLVSTCGNRGGCRQAMLNSCVLLASIL